MNFSKICDIAWPSPLPIFRFLHRIDIKNKESLPFNEKVFFSDYVNSKIPLIQDAFTRGYIHDDQVLKLLLTLNVNKSSGTDNLGPRILKLCAPIIYKVVAYLINLSIKTSILPDKLKEAKNNSDIQTRAPRGTDRSPEYKEHFCYKLDSRV